MDGSMSALSMQVGMLTERLRGQQRDVDDLKTWREGAEKRLASLEARPKASVKSLLMELFTPKQWATLIAVVLASLWGIVTPDEARSTIRGVIGLAPLQTPAPRS